MLAALAAAALVASPAGDRVLLEDPGLSIAVPRGWHLAQKKRTALGYPVERIVLSSGRLGPPHPSSTRPGAEFRRMGPRDALLFVVEYTRGLRRPFPRMPRRFVLHGPRQPYGCFLDGWLLEFRTGGRNFQANIALGPRARRGPVLAALASLRVEA